MTDDGQLDLDGIVAGEPEATKSTTARKSDKAVTESSDTPETTHQKPDAAGPVADAPAAVEPTDAMTVEEPEASPIHLEPTAEGREVAPAEAEPLRVFFLTNRMNLNGVLSSRMIAPRESFQKYYADLLELCPGWVPLLTVPPPAQLVERVVAERGAGAPVLVELSDRVLNGERPDGSLAYVRAALVADAKAIYFRDKRSLREHRARGYDNVHPHEDLLQVNPELFESDADDGIQINAPEQDPATDWLHLDRVRGAVNAVVAAADSGEALAVAASVFGVDELPDDTVIPPWLSWDGLAGEHTASASQTPTELADRLIFQAAYRVLSRQDQSQSWSPSDVLETVASEIAAGKPSDEARTNVDRSLQRVRELIDVEREFEPFRNSGSPYVAAKSFLMVLLRPDLGQILDWPNEETGADVTTRSVAAILAGCLRGVARESILLRRIALDDLTAAWAVRAAQDDTTSLGTARFVADQEKTALLLDDSELCVSAPLVPDPIPLYEALSAEAQRSARITVSRRLGWPIVFRVHIPADSRVQRGDSLITITSTDAVTVETSVDEKAFLDRLRAVSGRARGDVNAALREAK